MTDRPMASSRSTTDSEPFSAWVGSVRRACRADPSSATAPTTRLVPPMSIPRMKRTLCLRCWVVTSLLDLQNRQERLLRDLHTPDLLEALLAFLLLLQELPLPGHVA